MSIAHESLVGHYSFVELRTGHNESTSFLITLLLNTACKILKRGRFIGHVIKTVVMKT